MDINVDEFIKEITRRTKENYVFIKQYQEGLKSLSDGDNKRSSAINKKESKELYEVVQLINSMYCMLVVPNEVFGVRRTIDNQDGASKTQFGIKEKNLKKYPPYQELLIKINRLKEQHRMKYMTEDAFNQESPVCSFIYNLRNALCHDGIGFLPISTDEGGKERTQIREIIFETRSSNSNRVSFIARIDIETMEDILFTIADLYSCAETGKSNALLAEYRGFYNKLKEDAHDLLK